MKIIAFLQNAWFRDPEGVKAMFAESPERRERYISASLFMGCLTGKRLKAIFGEELCDAIVWEEISPEIGSHASSRFPADPAHIERVLRKHNPDVVLCFGKLASEGLRKTLSTLNKELLNGFSIIDGPHPAARQHAIEGLRKVRQELSAFKEYR